jgi:argininosuccinate synthase
LFSQQFSLREVRKSEPGATSPGKNQSRFGSQKNFNNPDLQILRNWRQNFMMSFSFENIATEYFAKDQEILA